MKNSIQNQKGIALITILVLLVLGFAIVAILLKLAAKETKLARIEQGYSTALDAAKGATDLFIFMVNNGLPATPPFGATYNQINCLQIKTSTATSGWTGPTWNGNACPQSSNTTAPSAVSSNPTDSYDVIINNFNNYTVYLKVIDNTTTQGLGIANSPCYFGCYYYTVVALAQLTGGTGQPSGGTAQQAEVTFVYRYDQPGS